MSTAEIIEREQRSARPVAIVGILAVALFAASLVILASNYGGDSNAQLLREVDDSSGAFILAYVIRAIGAALLAAPLVYLFRAVDARSERTRSQLIGLMVAGPVFLGIVSILTGIVIKDAAPDFVAQGITGTGDRANDAARDAIENASLADVAAGFAIAGKLAFAIGMTYAAYGAMQVGLLTRLTGSLGAALGVASLIDQFFPFALLWLAYLGLLIGGWTPRVRPPAWAAGEAVPWPTPGERAAESLRAEEGPDAEASDEPPTAPEPAGAERQEPQEQAPRRKRKRRR